MRMLCPSRRKENTFKAFYHREKVEGRTAVAFSGFLMNVKSMKNTGWSLFGVVFHIYLFRFSVLNMYRMLCIRN